MGDVLHHARPIRGRIASTTSPGSWQAEQLPALCRWRASLWRGLAQRLHHSCDALELYPIDDVFLGMCLEVLGVRPMAHEGFKTFGISRNRSNRMNKEPCFFRSSFLLCTSCCPPSCWPCGAGVATSPAPASSGAPDPARPSG